jgi:hypothetical protein
MFTGLFQLIHTIAGRDIKLLVDAGTELPNLKEALVQFLGYVVQFEKDQIAAQAKAQADAVPAPEVTPDLKEAIKE